MERRAAMVVPRREMAAIPKRSHYITPLPDGAGVNQLHKWVPKAITAMSPWGVSAASLQTAARKAALPWQTYSNSSQASGSSKAARWPLLIREEKEKTIFDQHTAVSDVAYSTVSWRDRPVSRWEGKHQSCTMCYLAYTSHCHRDWIYLCHQLLKLAGKW